MLNNYDGFYGFIRTIIWNICYVAQHFQRNIVRGIEGFVAVSLKQMEIGCLFALAFLIIFDFFFIFLTSSCVQYFCIQIL